MFLDIYEQGKMLEKICAVERNEYRCKLQEENRQVGRKFPPAGLLVFDMEHGFLPVRAFSPCLL